MCTVSVCFSLKRNRDNKIRLRQVVWNSVIREKNLGGQKVAGETCENTKKSCALGIIYGLMIRSEIPM